MQNINQISYIMPTHCFAISWYNFISPPTPLQKWQVMFSLSTSSIYLAVPGKTVNHRQDNLLADKNLGQKQIIYGFTGTIHYLKFDAISRVFSPKRDNVSRSVGPSVSNEFRSSKFNIVGTKV